MSSPEPTDGGAIPRISIVMPAHNRERLLALTLDSVLAQTLEDWELVVYDDGSTDATAEVARTYAAADPRIRAAGGPNGGVAAARNRGFALTNPKAPFVIFLDSDDAWEPDALEALVGVLDAHPDYVSAHSVAACIDDQGRRPPDDDLTARMTDRKDFREGRLETLDPRQPTTFGALVYHNWVLTPGTQLIGRDIAERVGAFDIAADPADDWDVAIRVSRHGDIGFVDRVLLSWRRDSNTLSDTSPLWRRVCVRVRRKTLTDPPNTPEQTRSARLGYTHASRAMWQQARRCLTRREYGEALRDGAKSVRVFLLYLSADIPTRLRRSR